MANLTQENLTQDTNNLTQDTKVKLTEIEYLERDLNSHFDKHNKVTNKEGKEVKDCYAVVKDVYEEVVNKKTGEPVIDKTTGKSKKQPALYKDGEKKGEKRQYVCCKAHTCPDIALHLGIKGNGDPYATLYDYSKINSFDKTPYRKQIRDVEDLKEIPNDELRNAASYYMKTRSKLQPAPKKETDTKEQPDVDIDR